MRFDFTDLNLFRHAVEAGSITHGAQRSNLALAAASTRIRKMELAFGTDLLVRGRAGVTPTQAGRTLLQHAHIAQTIQRDIARQHLKWNSLRLQRHHFARIPNGFGKSKRMAADIGTHIHHNVSVPAKTQQQIQFGLAPFSVAIE